MELKLISSKELKALMPNVLVLDLRSAHEFSIASIKGSFNVLVASIIQKRWLRGIQNTPDKNFLTNLIFPSQDRERFVSILTQLFPVVIVDLQDSTMIKGSVLMTLASLLSLTHQVYRLEGGFEKWIMEDTELFTNKSNIPDIKQDSLSQDLYPSPLNISSHSKHQNQAYSAPPGPYSMESQRNRNFSLCVQTRVLPTAGIVDGPNSPILLAPSLIFGDWLYLGPDVHMLYGPSKGNLLLTELGIQAILNVGSHVPYQIQNDFPRFLHLACEDSIDAGIEPLLIPGTDFIQNAFKDGLKVYVHCQAGRSRSPTFASAYLLRFHNMTMDETLQHIRSRRPIIAPNIGFMTVLRDFEASIVNK